MVPLRHAGTFLCDLRLLGDGLARPSRARALIVQETGPVTVDRDQVFLIEDWRLRPDGTAIWPYWRHSQRDDGSLFQRAPVTVPYRVR